MGGAKEEEEQQEQKKRKSYFRLGECLGELVLYVQVVVMARAVLGGPASRHGRASPDRRRKNRVCSTIDDSARKGLKICPSLGVAAF